MRPERICEIYEKRIPITDIIKTICSKIRDGKIQWMRPERICEIYEERIPITDKIKNLLQNTMIFLVKNAEHIPNIIAKHQCIFQKTMWWHLMIFAFLTNPRNEWFCARGSPHN